MKRLSILLICLSAVIKLTAQIPYFGSSIGADKDYTYFQLKLVPNSINSCYATYLHGLRDNCDIGINFYTTGTQGWTAKYSALNKDHVKLGVQGTVSFDLNNDYRYDDLNVGVFVNGNIVNNFGYVSNTWVTFYRDDQYVEQWSYCSYTIRKVTLMAGNIHDFHEKKSDLAVGGYFSWNKYNAYLWGGNLLSSISDLKITIGIDILF